MEDPRDLLRRRLAEIEARKQLTAVSSLSPTTRAQPDLVAERLAQAPTPDTNIAPTDPRALDRIDLPGMSRVPPAQSLPTAPPLANVTPDLSGAPPSQPGTAGPLPTSGTPNAAYPFTPRPEFHAPHEHGQPIGFGQRILHSLKSAGLGFMRGGLGGAVAGGIGGAVDPNFYHRAQHYYRDLPLWQQRQQDEIEQAKTQQTLNESNARIGNIGIDNDLARQRFGLDRQNAEELVRHHGALETTAAARAAKVAEKPPIFDASRKAMWDAKSGKWVKAPGAENIPEKDMTPAERAHLKLARERLDFEKSKGTDTETEDVFGFPPGSESADAHRSRKQEAMTHIDSLIARGDVEPDEGAKMKLSWDNANPPPKPVRVGSRRARAGGGGATPSSGNSTDPRIGKTVTHKDGKRYRITGIDKDGDPIGELIQ